jgi:hypothetical protein
MLLPFCSGPGLAIRKMMRTISMAFSILKIRKVKM